MGRVKAKTVQERFGFADEELSTATHDEIVCWVADSAMFFAKKFNERDVDSCDVEWEPVIKNGRGFEVGFMDLVIRTSVMRLCELRYSSGEVKKEMCARDRRTLWIEVKTSILSLGVLFRQLSMYKDSLRAKGTIIVVCPDDTHRARIEGQGYGFVKYSPAQWQVEVV